MTHQATKTISAVQASVPVRHIAAVVVGNALEFYDFLTYAFFAFYIGRTFFPSDCTFSAGFVTRPIGGFVIGLMGDRVGRKPAMILSFSLMGIAITGLALTPPYAIIGIAAPVQVILFRMVQGFAVGGALNKQQLQDFGWRLAFILGAAIVAFGLMMREACRFTSNTNGSARTIRTVRTIALNCIAMFSFI